MHKHIAIGLIVLIFVLGVAIVFYQQHTDIQQYKQELADAQELERHMNQQPAADNKPPREAKAGHQWEWHGDHWHEMPIAQAQPVVQPVQVKQQAKPTYTGPLTYHEELLKTNPVKALRLQAEQRGHWSAQWIPRFPPDDEEAAEIARTEYLIIYYSSIGDTTNPICQKAFRDSEARMVADREKGEKLITRYEVLTYEDKVPPSEEYRQLKWERARMNDLARLGWATSSGRFVLDPARFASTTLLPK